ncbi:hypothetical protein ACFXGT_05165 [Streptomyces sp. NPDC059352]|uniref:hypothetical protein n=1 Tax=Streptomyces sp. NPDC059352 TaxID=3346810 RepID=UPI00367C1D6C
MARALDLRETAAALERYGRRAVELMVIGAVLLALTVGVGLLPRREWTSDVIGWLAGLTLTALIFGIGARSTGKRMRHVLGAGTWSAHAAVPVARTWHSATVVLASPDTGELWPLTVVAVRQRYDLVRPGPDGVLWWCGDPRRGGVIAPPGGGELIWAKPVRGRAARRRIVARAEREGLPNRPVPRSPQSGPAPATVVERRRRWGVWRWVVLAGAVAVGLGIHGFESSDNDPQVDLTVLSRQEGDACTVSWKDPFDGTARTGPYQCSPDLDPVLEGWDTGFVVSYGLWKGDLYNADLQGTPAFDVDNALFGLGALAALVGLVAGGVGGWRRRAVGPVPTRAPGDASRVSLANAGAEPVPTYALLAAHAERQAVTQTATHRPGADVREAPWWRVRGLRRVSGLNEVLISAAGCAGVGALVLTGLHEDITVGAYTAGVLVTGRLLVSGFRLLRSGRPAALLLARAATAPVPVVRRYTMLHDPYGGAPALVVFPAHGGPDDRPEGLLVLASPGTPKRPWLGLPSAPTGSVELRGWLDRADSGLPVVVPWIEGRPLWPAEPYQEAGGSEFAEQLERLAPPQEEEASPL